MGLLDWSVVAIYLVATVILGLRSSRKPVGPVDDYLLVGRTLTLPVFVVTLVSTWYGGVLGVGEYSYLHGLSNWLVLGAPYYVGAFLFAMIFARKARLSGEYTLPDLLFDTYGRAAGTAGTVMVLVLSLPAAYLLMLGVLLRRTTGMSQASGVLLSAVFCLGYIALRGFRSVVQTKGLQFALMFGGFLLLLPVAVAHGGGWSFLRDSLPPASFTALGGQTVGYVVAWYFIALQTLVEPTFFQRCFAASSPKTARTGIFVSILFFALFDGLTTFTGMYARAILPHLPSGVDAFPALGERLLPPALVGVFYCGMLATVMSTVDSFLFVGGVTFGRDLVWRLSAGRANQLRWTRAGLVVSTLLSTGIALGSESVVSLWYLFGSVGTAVLLLPLLGVFYPKLRPDRRFAVWGMVLSGIVTSAWLFGMYVDPSQRPWLGVEPIYPGLATALLTHAMGILARTDERAS